MQRVESRLDDATVAKIQATGKSVYEFLQEAVALKLQNDHAIDIADSIDRRLQLFEKKMLDIVEDRIVEGIGAARRILEEAIETDQKNDEEFRGKINGAFVKIFEHLKK